MTYNARNQAMMKAEYAETRAGAACPPGTNGLKATHADEFADTANKLELCVDRMERFFARFYNNETCEGEQQPSSGGFIGSIERATRCAAKLAALCDRLDQIV